jgi:hypothetical protein
MSCHVRETCSIVNRFRKDLREPVGEIKKIVIDKTLEDGAVGFVEMKIETKAIGTGNGNSNSTNGVGSPLISTPLRFPAVSDAPTATTRSVASTATTVTTATTTTNTVAVSMTIGNNTSGVVASTDYSLSSSLSTSTTTSKSKRSAGPIKMNAFDLINMVGGAAMNRLLQKDEEKRLKTFTQFSSSMTSDVLLRHMKDVFARFPGAKARVSDTRCRAKVEVAAQSPTMLNNSSHNASIPSTTTSNNGRGEVSITVQLYQMTPTLHMVECRRTKGDTMAYHDWYREFKERMEHAEREFKRSPNAAATTTTGSGNNNSVTLPIIMSPSTPSSRPNGSNGASARASGVSSISGMQHLTTGGLHRPSVSAAGAAPSSTLSLSSANSQQSSMTHNNNNVSRSPLVTTTIAASLAASASSPGGGGSSVTNSPNVSDGGKRRSLVALDDNSAPIPSLPSHSTALYRNASAPAPMHTNNDRVTPSVSSATTATSSALPSASSSLSGLPPSITTAFPSTSTPGHGHANINLNVNTPGGLAPFAVNNNNNTVAPSTTAAATAPAPIIFSPSSPSLTHSTVLPNAPPPMISLSSNGTSSSTVTTPSPLLFSPSPHQQQQQSALLDHNVNVGGMRSSPLRASSIFHVSSSSSSSGTTMSSNNNGSHSHGHGHPPPLVRVPSHLNGMPPVLGRSPSSVIFANAAGSYANVGLISSGPLTSSNSTSVGVNGAAGGASSVMFMPSSNPNSPAVFTTNNNNAAAPSSTPTATSVTGPSLTTSSTQPIRFPQVHT